MESLERKKIYEQTANEFWWWQLSGEQLLQASNYLYTEYSNALKLIKKNKFGKVPHGLNMLQPMIFLRASSLENFIKALYVKYGNLATDGNGKLIFKNHKLDELYTKLPLPLKDNKKIFLKKLSDALNFWGRYPIPTNYVNYRQDVPGIVGIQPIFQWSLHDEEMYLEILGEIRELLKDQTKGQKAPSWLI